MDMAGLEGLWLVKIEWGESRLLYKPGHDDHQGFGEPLLIMNVLLLVHLIEQRVMKSTLDGWG